LYGPEVSHVVRQSDDDDDIDACLEAETEALKAQVLHLLCGQQNFYTN
jgi:hypothetical protein